MRRALFISDTQIPFEADGALDFCREVAREFRIPRNAIFHVGDEVDCYYGGGWEKSPDAQHTPSSEINEAREKLKAWYKAFPEMQLATSNHGLRWARKASQAGIPSNMIVAYQKLLGAPKGWRWRDSWLIKMDNAPVYMFHGMGYAGQTAYRQAAIDKGCNVVFGHLHANAGIAHIVTDNGRRWGMNVGCLIERDPNCYAFSYGKDFKFRPWLGVGVVVDGGLTPILIPYDRGGR